MKGSFVSLLSGIVWIYHDNNAHSHYCAQHYFTTNFASIYQNYYLQNTQYQSSQLQSQEHNLGFLTSSQVA